MAVALPEEEFPWPFDGPDWRMALGVRPLVPARWVLADATLPDLLRERHRLLAERRREVLALVPGAEKAARAAADAVLDSALAAYPGLHARLPDGRLRCGVTGAIHDPADFAANPLELPGRLFAEDWCLMQPSRGQWRLTAAVLCFPNRWKLAEKLGRALAGIHQPVALYAERLAGPVDRFFDTLKPGRGVWRMNWSLTDDPALFQPEEVAHTDPDATLSPANAAGRLFFRVERQTLVRLDGEEAVLFGIRTYQRPLGRLDAAQRAGFASILRSVPPEVARYKGLHRTAGPALAVLEG